MKKKSSLKIIWYFLSRYKIHFIFLIGLAAITGILESFNVTLIYHIIDHGLGLETDLATTNPFLSLISNFIRYIPINDSLVRYCILFILLACIVFAGRLIYNFFTVKTTSKIVIETKQNLFNKCINSDYQFFIDNKQGEILYKTSTAPNQIGRLLTIVTDSVAELILSISIFTILFTISWKVTIFIIMAGVGYYYLTKYLGIKIHYRSGKKRLESGQTETVVVSEYTSGVKQIKVFETFDYWKKLFDEAVHTYWKHYRKGDYWSRVPQQLLTFLMYFFIGIVVIVIQLQYPGDFRKTIPLISTFALAAFMVLPKLSKFGNYRMQFMTTLPNIEVILDMLKDTTYSKIKNGDKEFKGLKSGIELRNVKFAHKNRDILLDNISLEIKKDKITALVGPSGSGKSTIVNLLLRLHDVDHGGVYIDNVNIKEFDIFTFLRRVGFVSQETFIYNASIKDNIAFGGEYAEQDMIEAAELANADDFIRQLPEKYDTIAGDKGVRLSGGEKQRIAIARAMIREPEVLILDEATSSLDNVSENVVQKAINKVSKNCTTFIIAHRLSTIKNADLIYVLDHGKIIESGTHRQLLSKKGKYWELYNTQEG